MVGNDRVARVLGFLQIKKRRRKSESRGELINSIFGLPYHGIKIKRSIPRREMKPRKQARKIRKAMKKKNIVLLLPFFTYAERRTDRQLPKNEISWKWKRDKEQEHILSTIISTLGH